MFLVALVAQLDRASVSEAEGYGFNSRRAHEISLSIVLQTTNQKGLSFGQALEL